MGMIMFLGFIALIALPSILWLYAIADVAINNFREFSTKIIWLLVLCFFPPLGTVLYFFVGRSQRVTYYPVGRFLVMSILAVSALMILFYLLYSLGHLTFIPEPPKEIQI